MAKPLDGPFLKKVWERLRDSSVPVVAESDYKARAVIASELNAQIEQHIFLPSTIHGYSGIQKGNGVTRFLPILSSRDMGVYYYLCFTLAPKILIRRKGIFGAWYRQPEFSKADEESASSFVQAYTGEGFFQYWWLKEWKKFNDLIEALIADTTVGRYVASTDIANFYDSIEVPRLISEIRKKAPEETEVIEALGAFLASWNRKHMGYMPSNKGIPQEILSDASRVLSHFYLQKFDASFTQYCASNNLTYIRWADDFLIFGGSKPKLESAVHVASRLLRDLGLNLNASKTRFMSKSELGEYRCLDMLGAISSQKPKKIETELVRLRKLHGAGKKLRIDTVFRAMIGYVHKNKSARTIANRAFLYDMARENRDLLHSLNHTQMLNYIEIMDDPLSAFTKLRADICKAEFGGPKSAYLHMMRKYRPRLAAIGMTKAMAIKAIDQIDKASMDSEVIRDFCIPAVREVYR